MSYLRRFGWFALMLCCITPGWAQLDTGSIVGTIVDTSGAVISNAKLAVQNMGTSVTTSVATDASGIFNAPLLSVGTYRVTASAPGFKTYVQAGIELSATHRINLTITLTPGAVSEQVTVTGTADLVQTASSTTGGVLDSRVVETLPVNGRGITQLMAVIPGMVMLGGTPSINGASDGRIQQAGIKYVVDGGDAGTVDMDVGGPAYWSSARINKIGEDAVEEVNMVTDSYSAEFGASTGGVINMISKSGTNTLHGSLFEYFRNEKLDSRNWFNPAPDYKPAYRLNQFGGSLGGPIIRDKLFFFGNYEGVRQRIGVAQYAIVPDQGFRDALPDVLKPVVAQLPLPNGTDDTETGIGEYRRGVSNQLTEDSWTGKLDYQITNKDRLTVRSTGERSFTSAYYGVGQDQWRPTPYNPSTFKIGYTRAISPTIWNEAAFYTNRLAANPEAAGSDAIRNSPQVSLGLSSGAFQGAAGTQIGPSTWDMIVHNTSFTLMDSLSWVKGRHQFKFGAQFVRQWDNKEVNKQVFITYQTLADFAANTPSGISTYGWPMAGLRGTANNFFAQDDVKVSESLTLNLGLRYQYDTVPTESHGRIVNFNFATGAFDPPGTPILNAPKTNFAPRLGFSYAPFRSRQTAIRGGFGILWTNMQYSLFQFMPANLTDFGQIRSIDNIQDPELVGFPTPDLSDPSFGGVQNPWTADKNWKTPYTEQWSLNVQQQFGRKAVLQVGYLGNHTLHLVPGFGLEMNPYINVFDPDLAHRIYPAYGSMTSQASCCTATYNALQVSFKRQLDHGLSFGGHYTWSHSLDEATLTGSAAFQDPANPHADYASADYDARHNATFYYTYEIPGPHGLPSWLGKGWQVNGLTSMRSGFPVNVLCGCDTGGKYTFTGRPDIVPGVPMYTGAPWPGTADRPVLNAAAFAIPADGTFGNAGRNILRGPSAYDWDFSVFKNFKIREGKTLQFRTEIFNIFNTPQFSIPYATLTPGFGQSFGTDVNLNFFGTQRQMQFALRYDF